MASATTMATHIQTSTPEIISTAISAHSSQPTDHNDKVQRVGRYRMSRYPSSCRYINIHVPNSVWTVARDPEKEKP
jgi:hypothetical protein